MQVKCGNVQHWRRRCRRAQASFRRRTFFRSVASHTARCWYASAKARGFVLECGITRNPTIVGLDDHGTMPVTVDGLDCLFFVERFRRSSGPLVSAHAGDALFDRTRLLTRYDERIEARKPFQRGQVRQIPHALHVDLTIFQARGTISLRCTRRRSQHRREEQPGCEVTAHAAGRYAAPRMWSMDGAFARNVRGWASIARLLLPVPHPSR